VDNSLREMREKLMIGKRVLARKAGISLSTMNRIGEGKSCRPETKRKIVKALGFSPWLDSFEAPKKRAPKG